jgi:4-amino-4-deoxy-L-arabinose transferase-like glycosyltransferase
MIRSIDPRYKGFIGYVLLSVICIAAFALSAGKWGDAMLWDESVYLATGENLLNSHPYYSEIDYRPPMMPVLIWILSGFMPLVKAGQVISSAMLIMGIIAIYLLGREFKDWVTGLISAVVFAACPFLLHNSSKVMTDIPSVSLVMLSIFFLLRFLKRRSDPYLLWSAIFMGLAILMRFTSIVAVVIVPLLIMLHKRKVSLIYRYGVYMLIPLLPYFVWAQLTQGFALLPFIKAQVIIAGSGDIADPLYYIKAIYKVGGPVILLGLALYLLGLTRREIRHHDWFLLIWAGLFLLYLSFNSHKEMRYFLPTLPPIVLLSAIGLTRKRDAWLQVLMALAATLAILFPLHRITYFDGRMDLGEDILLDQSRQVMAAAPFIVAHLGEGEVVYSHSYYPIIAFYAKRETLSTWPWDSSFYNHFPGNMPKPGLYLHFTNVDKEPDQAWLDSSQNFERLEQIGPIIIYRYAT